MLISLCTPVMNRLPDLAAVMPERIKAARISPPVEFVIVDYNSSDGLAGYIRTLELPDGISLVYQRYTGRNYWHMAHAFNLAMRQGSGEWLVLMGSDTYPKMGYFPLLRALIREGCVWVEPERVRSAIAIERGEFIACGGYDERFELYGPEDRDIAWRLTRRGGKKGTLPSRCVGDIRTPDEMKLANFGSVASKTQMSRLMRKHFEENIANDVTVANAGKEWGRWI